MPMQGTAAKQTAQTAPDEFVPASDNGAGANSDKQDMQVILRWFLMWEESLAMHPGPGMGGMFCAAFS